MPSLREKVTTYFRQLSFIAEPTREGNSRSRKSNDGNFITKYLEGRMDSVYVPGPDIKHGQSPNDLPDLPLSFYPTGPHTITAACTGPDEGLTGIKRSKLHLSAGSDIDFIDTNQDQEYEIRRSTSNSKQQIKFNNSNASITKVAAIATVTATGTTTAAIITTTATRYRSDQNANKTSIRSRKNSRGTLIPNELNSLSTNAAIDNNTIMTVNTRISSGNNTTISNSLIEDDNQKNENQKQKQQQQKQQQQQTQTELKETLEIQKPLEVLVNNHNSDNDRNDDKEIDDRRKDNNKISSSSSIKEIEKIIDHSLKEKISSQKQQGLPSTSSDDDNDEPIAGVRNWKMENDHAYGISVSLYEYNMLTKESIGNPIADCYGLVVRGNCAAMALADGVNWGDGARLAARSAVQGSLDYLDTAIFGVSQECKANSTRDVFVSLLRSFWEAHDCILEVGGALSTLTVAVVLPLGEQNTGKYVVCACNVGDSLGYIYSKKHGVREFTQGSHDITSMRDMRDALGALGPADGNKPELSNLTLSMTIVDAGDIVFLTSDGISDNFDPVVGKFAEAWTPNTRIKIPDNCHHHHQPQLASKRQNKSASALYTHSSKENKPSSDVLIATSQQQQKYSSNTTTNATPIRPQRNRKIQGNNVQVVATTSSSASVTTIATTTNPNRPKYMRSHTVIESRGSSSMRNSHHQAKFPRSAAGLPLVTGPQRHALTLLRLEDLLSYGINGSLRPCSSARKLCHLLVDFVKMITSARRKTLEQRELFYKLTTDKDGIKREVELNRMQHKSTRKRIVDSSAFASLPGKLDHATVVAFTVGSGLQTTEFQETNF